MKLSHAAALALVGWYLMIPPVKATYSWTDDIRYWIVRLPGALHPGQVPFSVAAKCIPDAPLAEWTQSDEFESLEECKSSQKTAEDDEKQITQAIEGWSANRTALSEEEKRMDQQEIYCAAYARCIATDDPRLKGN